MARSLARNRAGDRGFAQWLMGGVQRLAGGCWIGLIVRSMVKTIGFSRSAFSYDSLGKLRCSLNHPITHIFLDDDKSTTCIML